MGNSPTSDIRFDDIAIWTVIAENQKHTILRCCVFDKLKEKIAKTVKMHNFSLKIEGYDIKNQEDLDPYVNKRDIIVEVIEIVEWKVKNKDKKFRICRSDKYKDIKNMIKEEFKIRDFGLKIRGKNIENQDDFNIYIKMRNVIIEVSEINYWEAKIKNQKFSIHRYKIYKDLVNKISEEVSTDDFILKIRRKIIENQEDLNNYVKMRNILVKVFEMINWRVKNQKFSIYCYNIYKDLVNKIAKKVSTNDFILKIEGNEVKNQKDLSKYVKNRIVIIDVNIFYWKVIFEKAVTEKGICGETIFEEQKLKIFRCYEYDSLCYKISEEFSLSDFYISINNRDITDQESLIDQIEHQNRSDISNSIKTKCQNSLNISSSIKTKYQNKFDISISSSSSISSENENIIIYVREKINENNCDCLFKDPKVIENSFVPARGNDGNELKLPATKDGFYVSLGNSKPINEETHNQKNNGKNYYQIKIVTQNDLGVKNSINGNKECLKIGISRNEIKNGITEDKCENLTQTGIVPIENDKGVTLSKNNDISKYCYISKIQIALTKIGSLVYSPGKKPIGIIGHIAEYMVYVYPIIELFNIKLKAKAASIIRRMQPDKKKNKKLEKIYPHNECSYFYHSKDSSSRLIIYNDKDFRLSCMNINLEIGSGATFTSTPYGLVVVYKNIAYNVALEVEKIAQLNYEHVNHSSVWHKDRLYVISGKDCKEVEFFDNGNTWRQVRPLPRAAKQNAAVCSVQDSIYLMAGFDNDRLSNSVLKFTKKWKILSWVSPWKYNGMGLLTYKNNLILFGGSAESSKNRKYCELDINGNKIKEEYLGETGDFSNMSFGEFEDSKYFFINKNYLLRFSTAGEFRIVSTAFQLA